MAQAAPAAGGGARRSNCADAATLDAVVFNSLPHLCPPDMLQAVQDGLTEAQSRAMVTNMQAR